MWDIQSTTTLLQAISRSTGPDELLRSLVEQVGHSFHVSRTLVLSSKGLQLPQYRIVHRVERDDSERTSRVTDPNEIRAGGLLAKILHCGEFQSISDFSPESSDPAIDLLRGSRSLMAFPLFEEGVGTGVVVMLGPLPQTCNSADLCNLAMMNALMDRAIQAQRLAHQLEDTCGALDAELKAAADVQGWLLPTHLPTVDNARIAAWYKAARHSGGDYYDVAAMPGDRLGMLIADVSGKGAAAAVVVAVLRTILHELDLSRVAGPAVLLDHADRRLCALGLSEHSLFVTAFACILDPITGLLTYSSAGHNPPRLLRAGQRMVVPLDEANALPLGVIDEPSLHTQKTILLMPGDLALLYTDGIVEVRSSAGRFFGMERVDEILRFLPEPVTPASAIAAIADAVGTFAGDEPQSDDQTLLAMAM